jgi:hypothetical protein
VFHSLLERHNCVNFVTFLGYSYHAEPPPNYQTMKNEPWTCVPWSKERPRFKMCALDPSERVTKEEILTDPYFSDFQVHDEESDSDGDDDVDDQPITVRYKFS